MALGDDKFSKPEGKFYRDKNGSLREREDIEVPEGKLFWWTTFLHLLTGKINKFENKLGSN